MMPETPIRETLKTLENRKEQKKPCCPRTRSIKTRIETLRSPDYIPVKETVLEQDPLKQGVRV